ncbi:hypothetical protein [Xanthomonas phaseoli]|uniref:hypothetical protein n=1 Tax=Xanthomonas phaseoli TaxID=1985254 RepID=UPI001E2D5744|nr:hypothetical protein [Xanthomonas phaseoli]MCC8469009.1 hypothetical protein [Xanthomonas phaseoli]
MNVEASHSEAMRLYEQALSLRAQGDFNSFQENAVLALEQEKRAAYEYEKLSGDEPTRSVLFRSAATIAIEAGKYEEALEIAGAGLARRGPIVSELVSLVKDAEFRRNLRANNQRVSDETLRLSLDGCAVGFGFVPYQKFQHRIDALSKMIRRTFDRLDGVDFSDSVRSKETVKVFLGAPMAGSFAVDVRVGELQQTNFPWATGRVQAAEVLTEIVKGMRAFEDGNLLGLNNLIEDESYRRNFAELGRQIIPDGSDVTVVTLESGTRSHKRDFVRLKVSRKAMHAHTKNYSRKLSKNADIVGVLRGARQPDDDSSFVEVLDEEGKFHKIRVAEELMADIVRPLWDKRVIASIFKKGSHWELEHMAPAESAD